MKGGFFHRLTEGLGGRAVRPTKALQVSPDDWIHGKRLGPSASHEYPSDLHMPLTGLLTPEGQQSLGKSSVADDMGPAFQGQFRLEVTWKKPGLSEVAGPRGLGAPSSGNPTHTRVGTLSFAFNWSSELRLGVERQDCKVLTGAWIQDVGNGGGASKG